MEKRRQFPGVFSPTLAEGKCFLEKSCLLLGLLPLWPFIIPSVTLICVSPKRVEMVSYLFAK
jgi:cellulose synthase/poly-beta-1,6-N-acetylglucosamine synthase-like glycosyltransferase